MVSTHNTWRARRCDAIKKSDEIVFITNRNFTLSHRMQPIIPLILYATTIPFEMMQTLLKEIQLKLIYTSLHSAINELRISLASFFATKLYAIWCWNFLIIIIWISTQNSYTLCDTLARRDDMIFSLKWMENGQTCFQSL